MDVKHILWTTLICTLFAVQVQCQDHPKEDSTLHTSERLSLDFVPKNSLIYVDGIRKSRAYVSTSITPNQIASMNVYKGQAAVDKFGEKGKTGVISIITKNGQTAQSKIKLSPDKSLDSGQYRIFYMIDGKEVSEEIIETLNPADILSIDIIKDQTEIALHTSEEYDGLIKILMKKE